MQDILESDWTLGAVKRREEERLSSESAARARNAETTQTPHTPYVPGDNWVAEAFRRRQAAERTKAASHQRSDGERADSASREIPVDNWLVEGFKRHQEEERRLEIIARSDEAVAPSDGDDDSNSSPMRALVVVNELSPLTQGKSAGGRARADDQFSSGAVGALVSLGGERALVRRRPSGAGRLIAIVAVVVFALVSFFGLKTALWNSGGQPRGFDRGAPGAAPPPPPPKAARPAKKETPRPGSAVPSHGEGTPNAPPPRPAASGVAPIVESPPRPADAAPAKPGEAATIPAAPVEAPHTSTRIPAAPRPQPESKAPSPPAAQGDKSLQEKQAAPAAPVPPPPKEAAPPAQSDKGSTAQPAPVRTEGAREEVAPEAEPKRLAPNAKADSKPKPQAQQKSGARRSSRKSDGFSTFLKRTANSVRKFFGRLGARQ